MILSAAPNAYADDNAARGVNPADNLTKIDYTKLVSRMIWLYNKLKQKGTEFSSVLLSPMVRAVIRDAITEDDKNAVKVDFEYLTEQLVLNLSDVIKASLKHRAK